MMALPDSGEGAAALCPLSSPAALLACTPVEINVNSIMETSADSTACEEPPTKKTTDRL